MAAHNVNYMCIICDLHVSCNQHKMQSEELHGNYMLGICNCTLTTCQPQVKKMPTDAYVGL